MKCYSVINWSQQTLAESPSRILWIISLIIHSGTLPNINLELTNLEWQNILFFFLVPLFKMWIYICIFLSSIFSLSFKFLHISHCPPLHPRILHSRVWFAHNKKLKLIFSSKIISYTISFHLHFLFFFTHVYSVQFRSQSLSKKRQKQNRSSTLLCQPSALHPNCEIAPYSWACSFDEHILILNVTKTFWSSLVLS